MVSNKSTGVKGRYQSVKPVTDRNIGKDLLKSRHNSYQGLSGIGKRGCARRKNQMERGQLKYAEIKITPRIV